MDYTYLATSPCGASVIARHSCPVAAVLKAVRECPGDTVTSVKEITPLQSLKLTLAGVPMFDDGQSI